MTLEDVLLEVYDERMRQDDKFGGEVNDDKNTFVDWLRHIRSYTTAASVEHANGARGNARRKLIQVAALAVAAVEAMDRGKAP